MKRIIVLALVFLLLLSGCSILEEYGVRLEASTPTPRPARTSPPSTPQNSDDSGVVDFIFGTESPTPQATGAEEISSEVYKLAVDAIAIAEEYMKNNIDYLTAYEKLSAIYDKLKPIYEKDQKTSTLMIESEILSMCTYILLKEPHAKLIECENNLEKLLYPSGVYQQ